MANPWTPIKLEAFPLEPLPDLPEFKSLIDIWDATRGDALMPRWRDFLFDDLMPWIGRLAMSKFDGEELHAVLFGGAFVELFGQELTGKPFFASLAPAERELLQGYFMNLIAGPCIGHAKGSFPLYGRDHKQIHVLDLPLAENGRDASGILHALAVE